MNSKVENILITGADGYIGSRCAKIFLETTQYNLMLWVRSGSVKEFEEKKVRMRENLGADPERVYYYTGNLKDDDPFKGIPSEKVTSILHTAAVTRFNVDEELADQVNIKGSVRLFEFARKCPNLKDFNYLSTIYATGKDCGELDERLQDYSPEFQNHYERSKHQAEKILGSEYKDLAWRIIRMATVIADNEMGKVSQYNVFHNTLRLLYNGLISLLPGQKDVPIYLLTGDFASQAIVEVMLKGDLGEVYHVSHTQEESASLGELLDWVFEVFKQNPEFQRKNIMKPLFSDEKTFNVLASNLSSLSHGVLGDALGSIIPFSGQLYISKEFKNQKMSSVLNNYRAPDAEKLIKQTAQQLIDSKWGREQ